MASLLAVDKSGSKTGWDLRHNQALGMAIGVSMSVHVSQESAIVKMLRAWADYAIAHRKQFDSLIGEDYVLGPEWKAIGLGIRGLLNGDLGRLDGGTLDKFILETMDENGIDTNAL